MLTVKPLQPREVPMHHQTCDGKKWDLRFCADCKVHLDGKVLDEGYPLTDVETFLKICMETISSENIIF